MRGNASSGRGQFGYFDGRRVPLSGVSNACHTHCADEAKEEKKRAFAKRPAQGFQVPSGAGSAR
eukprot:10544728-Alexandrium_andersonii.AAC.1